MSNSIWLLVAFLLLAGAASGQGQPQPESADTRGMLLDVVVTPKSGPAVTGLKQQDFTILDDNAPQTITSFRAFNGRDAQIEFTIVLDSVNLGFSNFSYAFDQVEKFLRSEGGQLAHPVTIVIATDTDLTVEDFFSTDGNKVADWLAQHAPGLRGITRSGAVYGAEERFQISLKDLGQVAVNEAHLPGRKIVIYVSAGWPFLSGPEVHLYDKAEQQLFAEIGGLSTQFDQSHVTLYSIDPLGIVDNVRNSVWKDFLKPVAKPSQVQAGDLALQVLAAHSGGVTFEASNDIATQIGRCIADTESYYELTFDPARGRQPNEYHRLEVRVSQPGLTVRTRQGYYAQP